MVTIDEQRLAEVTYLDEGEHEGPHDGYCVMECVAYIAGEDWTDHPRCACPVITKYALRLNDRMPDDQRQRLLPYVVRIAGSRSTRDVEQQRAYLAATWAVKRFAPRALEALGFAEQAATLRSLSDITDRATAAQAKNAAYAAYAAYAADAADAADAAYAVGSAADAAYAVAADDAWDDADADAAEAAADAAYAVAADDAWDDALACLDALLALGSPAESEVQA